MQVPMQFHLHLQLILEACGSGEHTTAQGVTQHGLPSPWKQLGDTQLGALCGLSSVIFSALNIMEAVTNQLTLQRKFHLMLLCLCVRTRLGSRQGSSANYERRAAVSGDIGGYHQVLSLSYSGRVVILNTPAPPKR